ncbi:MAG: type I secretion protein TolC [Rhodospirillaceae bacterium]|nr:type I secretion protein TolC [Rhodospirillaceae bacterium]|tara:strand:+ start:73 stop:1383 length:1311 start_codon:yes stop_codon:yes gene_type:complete
MYYLKFIYLTATTLIFSMTSVNSETFNDALTKAYLLNPTLAASRAQLRSKEEKISEAWGGWYPTIEFSLDAGKNWKHVSGNAVSSANRNKNLTPKNSDFVFSQNIYQGGKTSAALKVARAEILAQRARLLATEQDVLFGAGRAYVDVVRDEAVLKLNRNNEAVLLRQLEATRDRFEVGEVTRTDVAQAKARHSGSIAESVESNGQLSNSRASYRNIIGDFPGVLKKVKPLLDIPTSQSAVKDLARELSPGVLVARYEEKTAAAKVEETFSGLLPSVDIEGRLSRSDALSAVDSRTDNAKIFAKLTIPLYQSGIVRSRLRAAKQIHAQKKMELNASLRRSDEKSAQAWENLLTANAQISALTAEITAATTALEGVKQEAKVGSRTVLDVLDAEQELLDARVNLVRAERNKVVASMELHRAIGNLTAKGLNLDVNFFD